MSEALAPQQNAPTAPYKFSDDELRMLKECNTESFYYRCVPYSFIAGGLAYAAVSKGFLKGSPKYGALPKVALAIGAGYILGKFSYRSNCEEKIMTLPNSELAQMIRKRRGRPMLAEGHETASDSGFASAGEEERSDSLIQEMRAQDFAYGAPPTITGLDDSFRPSMDSFNVTEQPLPPVSQNVTSYEDLRKENRREYVMSTLQKQTSEVPAGPRTPVSAPTPVTRPIIPKAKNAYGDVWEE